jgi:hypothetical protein
MYIYIQINCIKIELPDTGDKKIKDRNHLNFLNFENFIKSFDVLYKIIFQWIITSIELIVYINLEYSDLK